ncbi:MAG: toll/interleukin-1 receptor domain-containing protein [Planctomycetota bacterium]
MGSQTVFISYSHKDKKWVDRLRLQLQPVAPSLPIVVWHDVWHDSLIGAGSDWRHEIREAISRARVAVLLVSADYLASDDIRRVELAEIFDAADRRKLTILPVFLRGCAFERTRIADYCAANDPLQPLDTLPVSQQERVLQEICHQVMAVMQGSAPESQHQPADAAPRRSGGRRLQDHSRLGTEEQREIAPVIREAAASFQEELPELLRTHRGEWVIYVGSERLGFGESKTELLQEWFGRGYEDKDVYVAKIEKHPPVHVVW